VLGRALAKDSAARFASVAEFAAAFRTATTADLHRPRRTSDELAAASANLFDALMDKVRGASILPAPSASVTYGAAGLAYGLMRLARTREDGELLALADLWSVRAGVRARDESAFHNAELEINPETVGRSSPYHTMSGVHWVRASIAQAI